jgi:ABC-type spermidine/putrescine transport system permease subunit II
LEEDSTMSNPARCTCLRCSIRNLMGPAVVTTIGVLFLLSELGNGYFHIGHTYPVLFIVMGAILLASSLASMDGHVETAVQPMPPPANPAPPAEPPTYSNPYAGQGQ